MQKIRREIIFLHFTKKSQLTEEEELHIIGR